GGAGIGAANQAITTGVGAMGSPTSYASLANPYTSLAGTSASLAGNLFSGGNVASANEVGAVGAGTSALTTRFSNQSQNYQAQLSQSNALWGGIGQLAGAGIGAAFRFSDRRVKRDIKRIGALDGGLPVYRYRYVGDDTPQIGLMA